MNPAVLVLIVAGVSCAGCWIASVLTRDTSWVDRIWSIVPAVYVWIFAIAGMLEGNDPWRLLLMALLVTAWAVRLTFNFARKGGYSGMEDYRWAILRGRMRPWQFQLFNLIFIVLYQNALLVLITLPALIAWQNPAALTGWDVAFAVLFAAFLVGEFAADQQQWDFHRAKAAAGGHLEPGFVTTGLFRVSRHPNFFFEQAQWWTFYVIGATAAVASGLGFWGGAINWTITGAVLLSLLFVGSTLFTESITSSKYPGYAQYRRRTSMLVPLPPKRRAKAVKGARAGKPGQGAEGRERAAAGVRALPSGVHSVAVSGSPRPHIGENAPGAHESATLCSWVAPALRRAEPYAVAYPSGLFDCQFQ